VGDRAESRLGYPYRKSFADSAGSKLDSMNSIALPAGVLSSRFTAHLHDKK
jgi:hypothetical protein